MHKPAVLPLMIAGILATSLVACDRPASEQTSQTPAVAAATAPAKAALGSFGFDAAGMDKGVVAGDDFFGFANGSWVKNTEIPADRSSYNSFSMITEKAQADTRAILEDAAGDTAASGDRQKIGDYYAAFMDEAGIEARGLAPVKAELEASPRSPTPPACRALSASNCAPTSTCSTPPTTTPTACSACGCRRTSTSPTRTAPYLVQGGLGMPDRDFYLEGGRMAELRKQYQAHIAKVLTLAGIADADSKAARILALETSIARVHATQLETNDVEKGANAWKQADFATPRAGPGLERVLRRRRPVRAAGFHGLAAEGGDRHCPRW